MKAIPFTFWIGIFLLLLLAVSCQEEQPAAPIEFSTDLPAESEPFLPLESTPDAPATTQTNPPYHTATAGAPASPIQTYGIYWMAGFERGDLREYEDYLGEFLQQSPYGSYQITSELAKRGNFSAALTINTAALDGKGSAAAYLAFYQNPAEGYYSGWIYIPEEVVPQSWWNIWQWKSTYNGDSDDSVPMWVLDLTAISNNPDELLLKLIYRADDNSLKREFVDVNAKIPKGEWVHLSTYYKKSTANAGIVGVWINGEQVFYLENMHTTMADNTLYWSVNNYSNRIDPSPCTIYFDDLVISQKRIAPDAVLP